MTTLRLLACLALLLSPAFAADPPVDAPTSPIASTRTCDYPEEANRNLETGDVTIRFDVGTDGSLSHVQIARSSGHSLLDQAAIDCAATRWRNIPAMRAGQPVVSLGQTATLHFDFPGSHSPIPRILGRLVGLVALGLIGYFTIQYFFFRKR